MAGMRVSREAAQDLEAYEEDEELGEVSPFAYIVLLRVC